MTASPKTSQTLSRQRPKTGNARAATSCRGKGARIRARRARTPGLVVHYDIMRPFAKRFEHYANDPAIKELTASGAALTVLTLAPNPRGSARAVPQARRRSRLCRVVGQ